MVINGNEVNNLFLNGNRFKNINNDYYIPVGTEFYEYYYQPQYTRFQLGRSQADTGINIYVNSFLISNAATIFAGTPAQILKNYHSDAEIVYSKYIDANAIFFTIDKFNSGGWIYLFTPETFEKLKLINCI